MGSLSKSNIYDAGKRKPDVPRVVYRKLEDGTSERRTERWPSGVAEQFVNLAGSQVTCQLLPAGVPKTPDGIARSRNQLHRKINGDRTVEGFVEYDKCPLRHGAHLRSARAEDEFAAMPDELKRPCAHDPETVRVIQRGQTRHLEYSDPCPHIKWLMESRQARAAARAEARSARQVSPAEIEAQKLAIAQATLEEQRKTNERMAAAVEQVAARQNRKAERE